MALHEADDGRRPIARWEPLHTFVCCVDAALREQRLEAQKTALLLNHALAAGLPPLPGEAGDGVPAPPPSFLAWAAGGGDGVGDGGVLGELAMLLSPPPCVLLLTETLLTRLEAGVVDEHALPSADGQVRALVQLFLLALNARRLRAPSAETRAAALAEWASDAETTLRRSLPTVAELIVGDRIRGASAKAPEDVPPPPPPAALGAVLRQGLARRLVLLYVVRRLEAADEARVEQLLPLIMADLTAADLRHHPEFAGGLVGALLSDPTKRLTRRLAAAVVNVCLVPMARELGHVHAQLLRLLTAQWPALHAIPASGVADTVDAILASRGVDSGSIVAKMPGAEGGASSGGAAAKAAAAGATADGVLSLLQFAARAGKASGAVDPGSEGEVRRSYERLEALVPGLI